MGSSQISKIQKAVQYAHEKDRFEFQEFTVKLRGTNGHHTVSYRDQRWNCDCEHFKAQGDCSHKIACEKVLGEMLPGGIPLLVN
jgi:hypothetical protein